MLMLIYTTFKILMQALIETQELRVTSMSTALLILYIDSAKNLPVHKL